MGMFACGRRRMAAVALAVCLAAALLGAPGVWAEGPEEPGGVWEQDAAGDGGDGLDGTAGEAPGDGDGGPVTDGAAGPEDGPGECAAPEGAGGGAAAMGRMPTASPLSAPVATTIELDNVEDVTYDNWKAENGVIELTGAGPYVLTKSTSDYRVVVSYTGGPVAVTLRDASITTGGNSDHAFAIAAGAEVALWLEGSSRLAVPKSLYACALHVPEGAAVEIDGASGGSLEADSTGAFGGSNGFGAGIGGAGSGEKSGRITIAGGAVTAKAAGGAGIGGGYGGSGNGGDGGGIYITGGVVVASSNQGAGIGGGEGDGGDGGAGGEICIFGGAEVTASSSRGAGIGGGRGRIGNGGDGGAVVIGEGAVVRAKSDNGADIGGGSSQLASPGGHGSLAVGGGARLELLNNGTGVARDADSLEIGECVIEDANGKESDYGESLAGSYRWLTVGGGSIDPVATALEAYWLAENEGSLAHQVVGAGTSVTVSAGGSFGRWYTGGIILDEAEQTNPTVTFVMPAENSWIATTDLDYVPPGGSSRGRSRSGGGGSSQRSSGPVALVVTAEALRWDGGPEGLTFSVTAAPIALMEVRVDGLPLESGQYRVGTDSAAVTLPGAYLEGLPAGEHTLTLQLWHGVGTVRFTV